MSKNTFRYLLLAAALLISGACKKTTDAPVKNTVRVQHGHFDITVLESGTLETAVSNDIIQNVRRNVKIMEIVDEGTTITEEDVKNKRVLIKFESKDLEDVVYERASQHEDAVASCTQAEENLAIQKSDNESSIRSARLEVLYAENDLRKLIGDRLADKYKHKKPDDIPALLNDPDLGGQVKQDLINNSSEIQLAQIRLNRAEQKLEFTRKLYAKQFVSKNELETDELEVESQKKTLTTTKGKYEIFRKYDFITNFYKIWSGVLEANEKLDRAIAVARSKLVSSKAVLRSRKQNLIRSQKRLEEAQENLAACTVYATAPGLVVYQAPPRWMNTGPIRPGTETRNRQTIIKLPDLSQMTVKVNIHEAQIDLIKIGQPAIITIDAMPEKTFTGKVMSRAILPSAQNQWLNPDLKVYETVISFDHPEPNLRPGMNATAEIIIERLYNITYVPCQAVRTDARNEHFCYSPDGRELPVKLGKRNRVFVQVLKGLKEDQKILLTPPEVSSGNQDDRKTGGQDGNSPEQAGGKKAAPSRKRAE